jgi:hypothetical protein
VEVSKLTFNVRFDEIWPWESIETAPKNGSSVLTHDGKDVFQARWCEEFGDWLYPLSDMTGNSIGGRSNPTHWMPLPEPPK